MVIIGIDPHKSSFTAVAVNRSGATVGSRRFVVNAGTATALCEMVPPGLGQGRACRPPDIDSNIKANEAQMRDAVAATTTTLRKVHGINTVRAAKLLGHIRDITRFPSADHFAGYTGTAPLAASSGENTRHRLNTGGNRQLNSVLHTIAVCQARDPGPGRVYYQRKLDEGKTRAEARRALKRRLANVLYLRMRRDQQHAPPTAA